MQAADLLRRGDLEEALEMAEKCVTMEPDNPEGFRRKGSILRAMNNFDEACSAFKKVRVHQQGTRVLAFLCSRSCVNPVPRVLVPLL